MTDPTGRLDEDGRPGEEAVNDRDIVCIGFADWETDLWTNQHHLMARLARTNRVLFVESLGLRRPTFTGRDLGRIARRVVRGLGGARSVEVRVPGDLHSVTRLHVLSPLVVPLYSNAAVRALNRALLAPIVGRAARAAGLGARPILWAYVPQAEALLEELQPGLVVYHSVDDVGAVERIDRSSVEAAEDRLLRRADVVLASAPNLAQRVRGRHPNVRYVPNVADTALFATALEPGPVDPAMARLPRPRLVFTGAIVEAKLDLELLVRLARARPDWSIALVGPVGLGDPLTNVSSLRALPNVHLLGSRPYQALPTVLRGADVALIPYAHNAVTASIFPMKVYEYLASGLPVVATRLPALVDVQEITLVDDAESMAKAISLLLVQDDDQARRRRSQAAQSHSWQARLAEIGRILKEADMDADWKRGSSGTTQ